ncbi:hypothetical protein Tco_1354037 [Tanacetum coccineum]
MQTPFQSPPRSSSQPKEDHIKKDKGKKIMSSEEAEKESTETDSNKEAHVTSSMVKSSKEKKLKKFDFVTEGGEHAHLTKEQISAQNEIEEEAKAEAARRKGEIRKEELIDLLGLEIVNKKGPITLKVYKDDSTSEIIPNFKASDLHLVEWREVIEACPKRTIKGWEIIYKQIGTRMDYIHTTKAELGINLDIPLSKQDPFDKLNDLANKKRKHADDIHDYLKATKRLKSSVQYGDHLHGTVLNEPILGPGVADHARTFSSLLLAKIDKRNLNPLKQMRTIELAGNSEGISSHELSVLESHTVMSDSKDSTVTYTQISSPFADLSDIEFMPPDDEVLLVEEQPLPVAASPTNQSPSYIPESNPEEDPEEDEEEEPCGDDADDEEEDREDRRPE